MVPLARSLLFEAGRHQTRMIHGVIRPCCPQGKSRQGQAGRYMSIILCQKKKGGERDNPPHISQVRKEMKQSEKSKRQQDVQ